MIRRGSESGRIDSRGTRAREMVRAVIVRANPVAVQPWTAQPTTVSTETWERVAKERSERAIKVPIAVNLAQILAAIAVAACREVAAASEAAADGASPSRMIMVRPSILRFSNYESVTLTIEDRWNPRPDPSFHARQMKSAVHLRALVCSAIIRQKQTRFQR